MTRDDQEMALWRRVAVDEGFGFADEAVEAFRKRYPPQPSATPATAPEAIWYDEPPFAKDEANYPCWIEGYTLPGAVYWSGHEWRMYVAGNRNVYRLDGRRVSPITKPQEPTT